MTEIFPNTTEKIRPERVNGALTRPRLAHPASANLAHPYWDPGFRKTPAFPDPAHHTAIPFEIGPPKQAYTDMVAGDPFLRRKNGDF